MSNSNVFTEKEQQLLDKVTEIREKLIDVMVKDGIPEDTKRIRMLNEILSGLSSHVSEQANTRLKSKEVDQNVALAQSIALQVLQTRNTPASIENSPQREFKDKVNEGFTYVDGQKDQGVQQFDPETIIDGTIVGTNEEKE